MSTGRRPSGAPRTNRAADIAERAEATRAALIGSARRLFVANGYHATGTEEIVAASGVGTRGALYHHFKDKKALFQAVFEQVQEDMLANAATAERPDDALGRLRAGLSGFLDASLNAEVQRVLLIDGPAVLGWRTWRAMEERYGLGAIRAFLKAAVAEKTLPDGPVDALAHILLAAVAEAALFIANADDPAAARQETAIAMDRLLSGLTYQREND